MAAPLRFGDTPTGFRRLADDERRGPRTPSNVAPIVPRTIASWNAPVSVPMPEITHTVRYQRGFVLIDPENLQRRGEPRYRNIWANGDPAGSTIQRRWSKRGRVAETQIYRGDPYERVGADGVTRVEAGSIRRVGNTPAGLVPPSLSALASMMTRPYEADAD